MDPDGINQVWSISGFVFLAKRMAVLTLTKRRLQRLEAKLKTRPGEQQAATSSFLWNSAKIPFQRGGSSCRDPPLNPRYPLSPGNFLLCKLCPSGSSVQLIVYKQHDFTLHTHYAAAPHWETPKGCEEKSLYDDPQMRKRTFAKEEKV